MKQGRTLTQLAQELERQAASKKDFVADTRRLKIVTTEVGTRLAVANGEVKHYDIKPHAHRQIADRVGIPAKYYERMLAQQPKLLADNVNTWFDANPERRLVRLLDDSARAFLSDKFQRIDHFDVVKVALPVLLNTKGVEVVSCEVTDSRLYIKWVNTAMTAEVKGRRVGDVIRAGGILGNSEVGMGSLFVKPFAEQLICLNGMIRDKDAFRRAHLGRAIEGDNVVQFLTDETKKAEDYAILLKVRDVINAAMDEVAFRKWVDDMQNATEQKIEGNPVAAVQELANQLGLNDGEQNSILRHLIEGADLSRYGVMNAVTRSSQDLDSYDRATDFEAFGGAVLDLPKSDWKRIAEAA